jgi:hypothetical protein
VTQGVGPEFKSQIRKKKSKTSTTKKQNKTKTPQNNSNNRPYRWGMKLQLSQCNPQHISLKRHVVKWW